MKDPAALMYIDTWLSSTAEMDADCRGWYLNLTLHQYDKGSLPNDIEKLAQLAVVRFSEFERFKQVWEQVLKHKFKVCEDGRLRNEKAKEILRKREKFTEKRSKSGSVGVIVKLANTLGFTESEKNKLKTDLYNDEIDIEQAKDKQMLKQLLKLYRDVDEDVIVDEEVNTHKLISWVDKNAQRVNKMKEPLTFDQCDKLKQDFHNEFIMEILTSMHNHEPLLSKNRSANLTFRNWANRDERYKKWREAKGLIKPTFNLDRQ